MSWYAKCSLFRGSKKALPWPLETITGPTSCVKRKMYWITKSSQHCILQIAKRAFPPHRECISWVLVPQLLEWASIHPYLRMHLGIHFQLSIARDEQNNFIAASVRKSRAKTGVVGFKRWIIFYTTIYFDFYNNPSNSRFLIGSHLSQTIDDDSARFNFVKIFWISNLNQSQFFAKHSNQSFRFILYRHYITSVPFSCLSKWRNLK